MSRSAVNPVHLCASLCSDWKALEGYIYKGNTALLSLAGEKEERRLPAAAVWGVKMGYRKDVARGTVDVPRQNYCMLGNSSKSHTALGHRFWYRLTCFTYEIQKAESSLRGRAAWLDMSRHVSYERRWRQPAS